MLSQLTLIRSMSSMSSVQHELALAGTGQHGQHVSLRIYAPSYLTGVYYFVYDNTIMLCYYGFNVHYDKDMGGVYAH